MENEEHYITDGVYYIHHRDQAVKMLIPGSYYDSQIYQGRLYLWCLDGSIMIIELIMGCLS